MNTFNSPVSNPDDDEVFRRAMAAFCRGYRERAAAAPARLTGRNSAGIRAVIAELASTPNKIAEPEREHAIAWIDSEALMQFLNVPSFNGQNFSVTLRHKECHGDVPLYFDKPDKTTGGAA